ncbi:MAG: hypothetical protein K2X38_13195 [Gemmataceae bacterium]|nr:hypothetical protein [Gemmataceae bacterium]
MVGSFRRFAAVFVVALFASASAHAYCGYAWYPSAIPYSYISPIYYSTPIRSYPIYSAPLWPCPIEPTIRVTPLAKETPAPASSAPSPTPTSKEPPLHNHGKAPTITESRSVGGAYAGVGMVLPRCKVGFWNLTGKEITVRVEGKVQVLPKDRAVTIELDRQFSWQAPGREQTMERVPEDQNAYEVIIRPNID